MSGGGKTYLALDLGAESGRAIAGTFDGERLSLREVHRFANVPVRRGENVHWDLPALFDEVKQGHFRRCHALPRTNWSASAWTRGA